jgi:hypothetical protein
LHPRHRRHPRRHHHKPTQGKIAAASSANCPLIGSQIHTERESPPDPHWYAAYNGKPEQPVTACDWYDTITHRWCIEPANRFCKNTFVCGFAEGTLGDEQRSLVDGRVITRVGALSGARPSHAKSLALAKAAATSGFDPQPGHSEPVRPFIAGRYTGAGSTTTRKSAGLAYGQGQNPPDEVQTDAQAPKKGSSIIKERLTVQGY